MKKFIILINLVILLTIIIASYNSCSTGTAQASDTTNYDQDSVKSIAKTDSIVLYLVKDSIDNPKLLSTSRQETIKPTSRVNAVKFKKKIEPIYVDSTKKIKRDSIYNSLEKTQRDIKGQQKTIDSLIFIKSKK
jgi:hypothetical protein